MSDLLKGDGRTHIRSKLMRESLQDRGVIGETDSLRDRRILPDITLVSIGGQSIFDRGKDAIVPLAEELAELHLAGHKMVLGVGGGTRVRHTAAVALDLGLPTGGVAQLMGAMEELNAKMLNALLAKHGSITMPRDHFWDLPLYMNSKILPIVISVPPYHFWEPPTSEGQMPTHRSDFGIFQQAEIIGSSRVIFVKDEDGMYNRDPKLHDDAVPYRNVSLDELLDNPPETNMIDWTVFTSWKTSKSIQRIQIVNGLERGQLTKAINNDDSAGTVITKEAQNG
jgi:molybdenum storage protein